MEMYGIKFSNRTKTIGCDAEDPAAQSGPFVLFASLCHMYGVEQFVRAVDYSSNSSAYWIDADPRIAHTDVEGLIALAADATLPQFILFDTAGFKGELGKGDDAGIYDA